MDPKKKNSNKGPLVTASSMNGVHDYPILHLSKYYWTITRTFDEIPSKQMTHYDCIAIIETESGSWPWTLKRYIQVCEGLPWFDVKSSLTVSMTPEPAEFNTLKVWALLFSRSYVNSARRNIFSASITESVLRPCSQPETLQSLGALDLSYATLCWKEKYQY